MGGVASRVAGTLVACLPGLLAAEEPREAPQGRCVAVEIGSTPSRNDLSHRGRRRSVFSLREVLDLNFEVEVAGRVAPGTTLELKLFTPNGHLYQTFEVPVAEEGSVEQERRVAGHPFPQRVRKVRSGGEVEDAEPRQGGRDAHRGRRLRRAIAAPPFPVAGTSIETHSLYGGWRVEARLVGSRRTCRRRFELAP